MKFNQIYSIQPYNYKMAFIGPKHLYTIPKILHILSSLYRNNHEK